MVVEKRVHPPCHALQCVNQTVKPLERLLPKLKNDALTPFCVCVWNGCNPNN